MISKVHLRARLKLLRNLCSSLSASCPRFLLICLGRLIRIKVEVILLGLNKVGKLTSAVVDGLRLPIIFALFLRSGDRCISSVRHSVLLQELLFLDPIRLFVVLGNLANHFFSFYLIAAINSCKLVIIISFHK